MNKIESKRLEPKPTRAKPPAMPSGKGSGVGKGKKGVLIQDKSKKKLEPAPVTRDKKPLATMRKNPVNAGPLKPTVKRNSMAEKQNKKVYVTPKPKSTAKPTNKKFGK
jgi:hypothetical protein